MPKKTNIITKIRQWLLRGLLIAGAGALVISIITYNPQDICAIYDSSVKTQTHNMLGILGAHCAGLLFYFFGCSAYSIIFIVGALSVGALDKITGCIALLIINSTLCYIYQFELFSQLAPGGLVGSIINNLLIMLFGQQHATAFLFILLWATLIIVLGFSWIHYLYPLLYVLRASCAVLGAGIIALWQLIKKLSSVFYTDEKTDDKEQLDGDVNIYTDPFWSSVIQPAQEYSEHTEHISMSGEPAINIYKLPVIKPIALPDEKELEKALEQEVEQKARMLEHKLECFGIQGKVTAIVNGPVVTLFEYQPSINTKISNILSLEDDLALALQALSLRIIAPIPGKSVVGFEVAHTHRKSVLFSHIVSHNSFTQSKAQLPVILGKDTLGVNSIIDLASLPHLLIGGSTGSGKSVGLNTLLASLLCSRKPDELKLILIDPKRLEFSIYSDIAHLLFPIVTEPAKAVMVLKWAVSTMEERYEILAQAGVKNCAEYNARFPENNMPFIVIIIDELADLMMTAGKEVEHLITRLAQMARAAGIHLVIATQRPSVDVITGLIKVNFPCRISFKVTTKVDSRTILDCMGAEKLLGKGDMLFLDTKGMISRIHGAYITDKEIVSLVEHIKRQRTVVYQDLSISCAQEQVGDTDELYDQILEFAKAKDEISISLVQRAFKIGYNRSARIIDQLESQGVIRAADGSKMRKVVKNI